MNTVSGARAVQIVYPSHRGSRAIEDRGLAHDDVELEFVEGDWRPGRVSLTWV